MRTQPTQGSAPSGSTRGETVAVLGLALLLRLLVLWDVLAKFPRGWFFTRGLEMGLLADSLVRGQGLASPFGPPTGPTAFIAPAYPLLVAAVFRVLGSFSVASEVVIMGAQIVLSLVSVWLILHIARSLFDRPSALLAGLIWACSLPLLWIPTIFWDTSLAISLVLGLFALLLRYRSGASRSTWMFLGAYCGLTALVNPALLLVLAALMLWLAFQTKQLRRGLLYAALACALVYSPWPMRNARVFHAWIPLRTTVGFELWMGNRPGADGFLDESLFPYYNQAELNDYRARGELGYTAHKAELARAFIVAHPATFVRLTTTRIARYWTGSGSKNSSALFKVHALITSLFGCFGLVLLWRNRDRSTALLFALPMLLFPLPYYITHAEFRYRLLLDPLLAILAGHAILALLRRVSVPSAEVTPASAPVSAAHV